MRVSVGVLILEPILGLADLELLFQICHSSEMALLEPRAHFLRCKGEGQRHRVHLANRRLFSWLCQALGNMACPPCIASYFKNTLPSGKHWYLCFPEGSSLFGWIPDPTALKPVSEEASSVSISIPKQDPALPKVQTNMDLKKYYFNPLLLSKIQNVSRSPLPSRLILNKARQSEPRVPKTAGSCPCYFRFQAIVDIPRGVRQEAEVTR